MCFWDEFSDERIRPGSKTVCKVVRRLILTICANHVFRFVNDHK